MKIDPGFLSHWKTERLIEQLGAEGVVAVLRLWGNAQIRREYTGLNLTPRRLAMETKWKGDENHLFSVLTDPDAPWLDLEEGGTYAIHGFDQHQKQVIALWENGAKGGRPKKVSPTPPSKNNHTLPLTLPLTLLGSQTKPNGNHLVSGAAESAADEFHETQSTTAVMLDLERRIQSLKPAWRIPLTYAEQQSLRANARCLDGLTDDDWTTIRNYLSARLPEGSPQWQPRNRSKFIESISDVFGYAAEWARKNGQSKPRIQLGP